MQYEWFYTLEEFIEWELRANKGSDTRFTRDVIKEIYESIYPGVKVRSSDTKEYLIDEILKKKSIMDLYNEYTNMFGIKPAKWIDKFNLTPSQRKKMVKEGYLLHIVYYNYEKVFTGTYADVPYYRAADYFYHTPEEVDLWKEENIRGYKKAKLQKLKEGSFNVKNES